MTTMTNMKMANATSTHQKADHPSNVLVVAGSHGCKRNKYVNA
jgi:hypothetical protein